MKKKTNPVQQEPQKKKRNGSYSKNKGNRYEQKIARELRELGFTGVKTSRTESKEADNNKIDIVDTQKKLPVNIQLKKTQSIPSYFKIREESTVDPKSFCIIWAKQEKKEKNICTVGEAVIMDKQLFYELLKSYDNERNRSNV
jgi:hypothetical protein